MLKSIGKSFGATAIVFIVLGIIMCVWPTAIANVFSWAAGLALLAGGLWKMVSYFRNKDFEIMNRIDFAAGALEAVMGVLLISHPEIVTTLAPMMLGVLVLADSIFKLQMALSLKKNNFSEWWQYLVMGCVIAIAAIIMMINPFKSYELLSILLGVTFIVNGLIDLWMAIYLQIRLKKLGLL